MTGDRYSLLRHIAAIGISVYDTILYLDIHDCPEARSYLENKYEEYCEAIAKYEEKFGPINIKGHPCEDVVWAWQIV